jgi:hypothetical protein
LRACDMVAVMTRGCPPDCISHSGTGPGPCPADCAAHPEHVYVLCYNRPVMVSDRDYLPSDHENYRITHYVGWTSTRPVDRIRRHANLSAHYVAAIMPGDQADEARLKTSVRCPRCGGSLWYFGQAPWRSGLMSWRRLLSRRLYARNFSARWPRWALAQIIHADRSLAWDSRQVV